MKSDGGGRINEIFMVEANSYLMGIISSSTMTSSL